MHKKSTVFLVLSNMLESSLAQVLTFELGVALADSLVSSISSVTSRFFLVWTTIFPGSGRLDPSVKVSTKSSAFSFAGVCLCLRACCDLEGHVTV
jgi:hypothetical protein